MHWYRYILARLFMFQIPRNKKRVDAYVLALALFCIPWTLWLVLLDRVASKALAQGSIVEQYGKWRVVLPAVIVIFVINHLFVRKEYSLARHTVSSPEYERWGTVVCIVYFLLPVIAIVGFEFIAG